ncbi:outer membrane protein transport protein [Persephonella sp. KM09-Lau-8]|uniref:OmpP1/FadL family transporter n=1 Tax=Persephonella sp. KM09-Lau-8 TaxID=1158345 RepID=UPI00049681B0|nr:outer membrane protein transport protein [Persephonella sp. KM09-Lau-8]
MRKVAGSVALITTVISTAAFATNGDNMIGVSPASRAMGGLGTGICLEPTDSIFRNPGWLARQKGFNLSFGGILFMPHVKGRSKDPTNGDSGYQTSDADTFTIPEIAITNQINDRVVIGLGAYGVSGMGVDYRDKDQRLAKMHTSLQFMRIVPAIGYKVNEKLAIGGALHLAWGALDLGAFMPDGSGGQYNAGGGLSQSYGIGASIGVNFKPLDNVCLGAYYQSPVKMKYKNVFKSRPDSDLEDLKLEQPQEISVGVGFRPIPELKFGFDVRWINWSDADGYKQFKWKDQWVFAVGGEYKATPRLALRAGYNYAKSPIREKNNLDPITPKNSIPDFSARFSDYQIEWFNLIGFPAITEHHITLGFGYQFTESFTLNASYVHAFEKKVESTAMGGAILAGAKNSQDSIGVSLDWHF